MTSESRALTIDDLMADLIRQKNPDLKIKVGDRWVTKVKYKNVAGKPHIELITNE